MAHTKRICILLSRLYKHAYRQLLRGMLDQLRIAGCTAVVFQMNEDCGNDKITQGELNLLHLIRFEHFDGVIFAPYTFSAAYAGTIGSFLTKNCTVPLVYVGIETGNYLRVWCDDRAEFAELVRHLIRVHHCRRILCLTGPAELPVAQNRCAGYRDAMQEAGLPADEPVYGDFWTVAPAQLAADIAAGRREMPDAIVCGNDVMALSLCDALLAHGIAVPEQIRITGYDGDVEGRVHVPSVTSYQTSQRQLGRDAACRLLEAVTGQPQTPCGQEDGLMLCRESCGCRNETVRKDPQNYLQLEQGLLDDHLSATLHDTATLYELVGGIYSTLYTFLPMERFGADNFYLCLCADWDSSHADTDRQTYRTEGYSDRMTFMNHDRQEHYAASELLPASVWEQYAGKTVLISAAHFLDRCFGCFCLALEGDVDVCGFNYVRFCREVCNALELLRVRNDLRKLIFRKYIAQSRDDLTGLYLLDQCEAVWKQAAELAAFYGEDIYLAAISLGGLREAADEAGKAARDQIIVAFANLLTQCCTGREQAFRVSSGGFAVIGMGREPEVCLEKLTNTLNEQFRQYYLYAGVPYPLHLLHAGKTVPAMQQMSAETVRSEIHGMLHSLREKAAAPAGGQIYYSELAALRRDIFLHPAEDWSMENCCRRLNVSRSYFHRVYRSMFGVTLGQDVQQSRIHQAQVLLVSTTDCLQSIAEQCGYEYVNFMRTFKRLIGVTPAQYRKQRTGLDSAAE